MLKVAVILKDAPQSQREALDAEPQWLLGELVADALGAK